METSMHQPTRVPITHEAMRGGTSGAIADGVTVEFLLDVEAQDLLVGNHTLAGTTPDTNSNESRRTT
jgi:hypothetical protein